MNRTPPAPVLPLPELRALLLSSRPCHATTATGQSQQVLLSSDVCPLTNKMFRLVDETLVSLLLLLLLLFLLRYKHTITAMKAKTSLEMSDSQQQGLLWLTRFLFRLAFQTHNVLLSHKICFQKWVFSHTDGTLWHGMQIVRFELHSVELQQMNNVS